MDVIDDCLEVTHGPDDGNIWTCDDCGEDALWVEAEKYQLLMQNGNRHYSTVLYVPISDKLPKNVVLNSSLCEPVRARQLPTT